MRIHIYVGTLLRLSSKAHIAEGDNLGVVRADTVCLIFLQTAFFESVRLYIVSVKAAAELERLQSLRTARSQQDKKMALYIRTLKKQPEVMHDWNDTLWTVMIEKVIVHKDGQITFVFQNGTEIKVGA